VEEGPTTDVTGTPQPEGYLYNGGGCLFHGINQQFGMNAEC
jgi:hypothetical protein